jgi:RNA polymerase sigma-70 factor, ECF subfamily
MASDATDQPFAADPVAFRAAFDRHYSTVLRLSAHLLGDRAEAEDLAQEVFVSLSRQRFTDADAQGVRAWLVRVTLNRGLNALRTRRRRTERERKAGGGDLDSDGTAPSNDIESLLERRRERRRVQETVATLEPRAAKLLMLRQLGMGYAELAALVDVAPGSIGTLLARAQRAFVAAYRERFGSDATGEGT